VQPAPVGASALVLFLLHLLGPHAGVEYLRTAPARPARPLALFLLDLLGLHAGVEDLCSRGAARPTLAH
jgi:hypothetical protein